MAIRVRMPVAPTRVRLLHVATVPAPIRNFYIPFARHFRALGWRVDAAAQGCTAVPAIVEAFNGVYELPFSRSVRDIRSLIRSASAMTRLLESTAPDIVHVHTPIASFVTRLAVRQMPLLQRPAIAYTAHGFHFYRGGNPVANMAYRTAERVAGRWTDRLVVINEEDESAARFGKIVAASRLVRMPGVGIDTDFFSRGHVRPGEVALIRQRLGIGKSTPLFAAIAELHPNKRVERVIEALSGMARTDAHLAIAGEGALLDGLQSAARRFDVQDRVHFLGFVDDVRPLLVAATGFVISSRREGLARSVMEALSLEVPIVASDARGNSELVGSDRGFIVPEADPTGLAVAMDRLTADPELARAMGKRGRRLMVSQYSQGAVVEHHARMYSEMLATRNKRPTKIVIAPGPFVMGSGRPPL